MLLLSFAQHAIESHKWESRDSLENSLADCDERIMLGEEAAYPTAFYALKLYLDYAAQVSSANEGQTIGIGIVADSGGLAPSFLPLVEKNELLIGFNSEVVNISVEDKRITYSVTLDGLPFYSFYHLSSMDIILIFYELGVVAINPDGRELWQYNKDVVSSSKITGEQLFLEFLDAKPVTLNIKNGTIENRVA
jgi:hypothetical protein